MLTEPASTVAPTVLPIFTPSPSHVKPATKSTFNTGKLLPTQVIAQRYVIVEKIAQGGMGAIYKAQDKRLQGKDVALKEMSEAAIAPSERQKVLEAFTREAQLLASLNHPNLVWVTDRFQEGDRHYLVMEFIDGQTLEELLKQQQGVFAEEQVLVWAEQLCDLLSYLHSQTPPIIYRDIKPANIMVIAGSDDIKLIDFGIARFFKPGQHKDTIQFGTEGYAPPEQYGKSQTDARTDVYSLGATLHELLTHYDPAPQPFNFPPVRQLNASVSKRVESAIAKAISLNKDNRYESMAAMWEALSGQKPVWFHLTSAAAKTGTALRSGASSSAPDSSSSIPIVITDPGVGASLAPVIHFRKVPTSIVRPVTKDIEFPAGNEVVLTSATPWLQVQPGKVPQTGGRVTVMVTRHRDLKSDRVRISGGCLRKWIGWHTARLVPAEREYRGEIIAERPGGREERIPVSVTVSPPAWQVGLGWALAIGAMLMELGVPLYLILVLLAG